METDILLKKKYEEILPILNEKQTRFILAAEAKSMGRGGLSKVSSLSGISRVTLNLGIKELASMGTEDVIKNERVRRQGGGRKKETDKNSEIEKVVEQIVNPHTMGDPMKSLLWTSKSLRNIAEAAKK